VIYTCLIHSNYYPGMYFEVRRSVNNFYQDICCAERDSIPKHTEALLLRESILPDTIFVSKPTILKIFHSAYPWLVL
jgi:hypothetical protein